MVNAKKRTSCNLLGICYVLSQSLRTLSLNHLIDEMASLMKEQVVRDKRGKGSGYFHTGHETMCQATHSSTYQLLIREQERDIICNTSLRLQCDFLFTCLYHKISFPLVFFGCAPWGELDLSRLECLCNLRLTMDHTATPCSAGTKEVDEWDERFASGRFQHEDGPALHPARCPAGIYTHFQPAAWTS